MDWTINAVIFLPLMCGMLGFLIGRLRNEMGFLGFGVTLYFAAQLFLSTQHQIISYSLAEISIIDFRFYIDDFSRFILLFNSIFAFLIWLYSIRPMDKHPGQRSYHLYLALNLAAANGVVLSGNMVLLLIFWNVLVFALYGLLLVGKKESHQAARKGLSIIEISDYIMMLGIIMLFVHVGKVNFPIEPRVALNDAWSIAAYILIMVGALAKAGSMPLHSWIPDAAGVVPASTMAYIPGSLDKLLGIYLLTRVSYYIFDISGSMPIRMLLMIVGSVTIVAAVMMAMVQKEAMRLLSFHAVSQVGYMVLGIGTGIPVGIAGGLFHMLNNAIYKACLFLCAGSVEYRAKTTDLDRLGGLGFQMPLTMFSFIVAAFAISGVPPFNGFYSKWMVYQGVLGLSRETNLWPVFLVAAMFGSVLTLASFLKMIHSLFLGQRPKELDKVREVRFEMITPVLILASLCIVFGVFAVQLPLRAFILPALPFGVRALGFWSPELATALILAGLAIGVIIFLLGTAAKPRRASSFVGGEVMDDETNRITGPNFYSSVHRIDMLEKTYKFAEEGAFDFFNYLQGITNGLAVLFKDVVNHIVVMIYQYVGRVVETLAGVLSILHNGSLYNYVGWIFLGGSIVLILLAL